MRECAVYTTKVDYPDYLLAERGLTLSDNAPIQPGETKDITITVQDARWDTERLSGLAYDAGEVDSGPLKITYLGGNYKVPGRELVANFKITNEGKEAVRIGEFNTAGLRFLNPDDAYAVHSFDVNAGYGEERMIVTGMVNGVLLTVVYTEREERTRLISARKATKHEQLEYYRSQTAE